jgi:hypothetical protein
MKEILEEQKKNISIRLEEAYKEVDVQSVAYLSGKLDLIEYLLSLDDDDDEWDDDYPIDIINYDNNQH